MNLRLLFVCGRNQKRSPTAERVFSRRPEFDCRSRGLSSKSPRNLASEDLEWSDFVFPMERSQASRISRMLRSVENRPIVEALEIPDDYEFMDAELVSILEERVDSFLGSVRVRSGA